MNLNDRPIKKILPIVALLVVGGVIGWTTHAKIMAMFMKGGGPGGGMADMAMPVFAVHPTSDARNGLVPALGDLRAEHMVSLAPEVAGRVAEVSAQEGQMVKSGDVLVRLDTRIAQSEFDEAKAALILARANHGRASDLAQRAAGTRRSVDESLATLRETEARLALAEARLAKMTITAPFDGVLGLRQVNVGDYVEPGRMMFTVTAPAPLLVDVRLPDTAFAGVSVGQEAQIKVDALPGVSFAAKVVAIEPRLDPDGRSLAVRLRVPNDDHQLRPGLFARAEIATSSTGRVLLVPERALMTRPDGLFVYRVAEGKAVLAKLQLAGRRVGEVEVSGGLTAEDLVITDGQIKLHEGAKVMVLNQGAKDAPAAEAAKP
ncbi:MAG: efflux RND transporter periplasmic adaptor subunit [Alphaproteobacteria bacterium]|nr:MAG: efflux RND transporter periplasmic adaptor subunit [Alphaproteobacteria bacterium]